MSRHGIVCLLVSGLAAGIVSTRASTHAAERPAAPAPYCFDARDIREAVQGDAHTIAVRLGDESRYRLELIDACPAALRRDNVKIASRHGWVCGSNDEQVISDGRACPLAGVAKIDAREFAELAMRGQRPAPRDGELETVEVRGRRRIGFSGSTAYCFDTRHMRGWREDGSNLVVEVSPIRSGGNRYYRVELASVCSEMTNASRLNIVSPTGGSAVCGNAGDRAYFSGDGTWAPGSGTVESLFANGLAVRTGCEVVRVYPVLPGEK